MSRDDPFLVRHSSWPAVGESNGERAIINRLGALVVTDFFTQLVLGGWAYHVVGGTEAVPLTSTTTVDDQLAFGCIDNNAGYAMLALRYQVSIEVVGSATIVASYLEFDKAKKRYSSSGTAFVPANLRGDSPRSFNGNAYVGSTVTLAKSAVPLSVELSRHNHLEDALANTIGYPMHQTTVIYSVDRDPLAVGIDASALVLHLGATTGTVTAYENATVAQLDKALVV